MSDDTVELRSRLEAQQRDHQQLKDDLQELVARCSEKKDWYRQQCIREANDKACGKSVVYHKIITELEAVIEDE